MPSPFPGMDPYLEGDLWPDFYQSLAVAISRELTAQLRPRYVARLAVRRVRDFTAYLVHQQSGHLVTNKSQTLPIEVSKVKLITVEVRNVAAKRVVTRIEIRAPVSKRCSTVGAYRKKWERGKKAGIHMLEIDLLRSGSRHVLANHLFQRKGVAEAHYRITLLNVNSQTIEAWPVQVNEPLPVIPVPLHPSDPDAWLDLGACVSRIYHDAAYDLSIDYTQKPPLPAFDEQTQNWIDTLLRDYQLAANTTTDLGSNGFASSRDKSIATQIRCCDLVTPPIVGFPSPLDAWRRRRRLYPCCRKLH